MPAAPVVKIAEMLFWAYSSFSIAQPPSINRFWAHSLISGFQPPLIMAFIVGNWAYTVIIRAAATF